MQRIRAPEQHNFDPFDFSFQPNASARRDYIKARHANEPLAKAYMNPTTNNQIGLTASSALEMMGLHMPLRAAMNGWDMTGVLQEVLNAVGVTAEGATFTAAEATVRLKQVLQGHRLDDHKRNLEAGPEPRSQGPAAIWLRPPAWPPAKAISWLGDMGLTAMIGLAGKDLGCRLRMPSAPDGNTKGAHRVWLPGRSNYMSNLYDMRAAVNRACDGRTDAIPPEIGRMFKYFSLRAGVEVAYTVVERGDLAYIATQKAREAVTANKDRDEAKHAHEKAEDAKAKAEDLVRRLRDANSRLRGECAHLRTERDVAKAHARETDRTITAQAALIGTLAATSAELAKG